MNELSPKHRRMKAIVARFQKYVQTYDQQELYMDFSDQTFIEDMVYGIGLSISPKRYRGGSGYDRFKASLRKRLEKVTR